jgi:hypothetical protein
MFEIYTAAASERPDVVAKLKDSDLVPHGMVSDDAPFLQIGYDEIDPVALDRVLEYAKISQTNGPVGIPRLLNPISNSGEWVLFPISGLR